MNDKKSYKAFELTDEQLEQVSGGWLYESGQYYIVELNPTRTGDTFTVKNLKTNEIITFNTHKEAFDYVIANDLDG